MNRSFETFSRTTDDESTEQSAPANILYVDSDLALCRVCTQTLTCTGYRVTAAEDGLYAWEALHTGAYDLLITDTETPRMSGLELAAMARLEGMKLPIIVASDPGRSFHKPDHTRLCLAATLQKPFAPGELIRIVGNVLRASSRARPDGGIFLAARALDLSRITPYQHWGLNE